MTVKPYAGVNRYCEADATASTTLVTDGLNTSANLDAYTPVLSNSSFTSVAMPLFQGGFELRCFQLLSTPAWLLNSALPDN